MMTVIGMDVDDDNLTKRIKDNPLAYSFNYDTYKILTYAFTHQRDGMLKRRKQERSAYL